MSQERPGIERRSPADATVPRTEVSDADLPAGALPAPGPPPRAGRIRMVRTEISTPGGNMARGGCPSLDLCIEWRCLAVFLAGDLGQATMLVRQTPCAAALEHDEMLVLIHVHLGGGDAGEHMAGVEVTALLKVGYAFLLQRDDLPFSAVVRLVDEEWTDG